ncbi:hypothetical protein CMV_021144 [Castanea mollissima]|uniref:60S ribosomal protein L21 n=1 Tax=Castanea mollissima TaxID=60419 RepID=A0A8J4V9I7_9ROSI|nr:hypothetical protein CMV_021144 [Castanea mollissima]
MQVGNRIIRKRIHVRVEHVQPSRCTEEFRQRKLKNDQLKAEAKAKEKFTRFRFVGPFPTAVTNLLDLTRLGVLKSAVFVHSALGSSTNCSRLFGLPLLPSSQLSARSDAKSEFFNLCLIQL